MITTDKHNTSTSSVSELRELSFKWSHHRILSPDSKVRVTVQNSIEHSGSERIKELKEVIYNPLEQTCVSRVGQQLYFVLKMHFNFFCFLPENARTIQFWLLWVIV